MADAKRADRILVVEDDADLRAFLGRIFADGDYDVALACDGAEAIEIAHAIRPDLVVLDITLPGLDGWAVLRNLHRLSPPPPVVMMSVQTQSEVFERASAEGVAAYIEKPFSMRDLVSTCEEVLRDRGTRGPRDRRMGMRRVVRLPAQVLLQGEGWWTEGEVVDLAVGGVRLTVPRPIPADSAVRLAFALPGDVRMDVQARMQWRTPEARGFAYGLRFTALAAESRDQIEAAVFATV